MLKFKLAISKRKKIPSFYLDNRAYAPYEAFVLAMQFRWMRNLEIKEETCSFEGFGGQKIQLLKPYFYCMVEQWRDWTKHYLPNFSLQGKTVLDVGAGCGETALFYLFYGVEKLVLVEPDPQCIKYLSKNAKINSWNAEILNEPFSLEHLKIKHDFMKMDCEGCEKHLLHAEEIKPCAVEVHCSEIKTAFLQKGFKVCHAYKKGFLMKYKA